MMTEIMHGGRLDRAISKYGGAPKDWIDLSTGINPVPYPVPEIALKTWARLPDAHAEERLLEVARRYYEVPSGFEIVAAPGTQSIIELLPQAIGSSTVSVVSPTYAEHEYSWRKAGISVSTVSDLQAEGDALIVVNPNNPTADVRSNSDLLHAGKSVNHLIIDEAFADPLPNVSVVPQMTANMIVLKSFGKFFGLAGLRLGFAICNSEVALALRNLLGPWAVSGPALQIGAAAFADQDWISNTILRLQNDSQNLSNLLKKNGFLVEGANPLFVAALYQRVEKAEAILADHRILVRIFPERIGCLRFGLCANDDQLQRLERALQALSDV